VLYGADLRNGKALAGMRITSLVGTSFQYGQTDAHGIARWSGSTRSGSFSAGDAGAGETDSAPAGRAMRAGLRAAIAACIGSDDEQGSLADIDDLEGLARGLVQGTLAADWDPAKAPAVVAEVLREPDAGVIAVLRFACTELVPRLAGTPAEITNVLRALDGRFIEPGPSGSPTRGLVSVLPTGRNFYSVDPKSIPTRNAFDVGTALADSLLQRHRADTGDWPASVGLTIWGTSAMRTQGDDIAEVLARLEAFPTRHAVVTGQRGLRR